MDSPSVTQTLETSTIPVNSPEWRALCATILDRDNRTCVFCAYTSPMNPTGKGLKLDHKDGDTSNNDPKNLRILCPPCSMTRHCGFAAEKGWLRLAKTEMEQVEIVRRTRRMFEESGIVPSIEQVDPFAILVERDAVGLENKLLEPDWEDLTDKQKGLRGFFMQDATELFAITMLSERVRPSNPSDVQRDKIRTLESTRPWISFSPESHSTVSNFLTTWRPSATSQSHVAWICIYNPHKDDNHSTLDRSGLDRAWDDICATRRPVDADLDELARRFDDLGGKWLVFANSDQVDSLWTRVARATYAGTLGIAAKVSPKKDGSDQHVICVFTRNYTDESDVAKVRSSLRRLGVRWKIGYKPDIYTGCGVYRKNEWGIRPIRYWD
ncbi:translation initiation factor eIF 4e-like domain-containing protein [Mycena floridula]|nr:translation initiation factor eIF 4e-like domain-containing protein [Mycena floridula]